MTTDEAFEKANATPKEIRKLIDNSFKLLNYIATCSNVAPTAWLFRNKEDILKILQVLKADYKTKEGITYR